AFAGDWPQFRGPAANSIVEGSLPSTWSADSNVRWKTPIPGAAWSCPVIVGDKIIVTTAVTENQRKPTAGFGGGGGGFAGRGRPGGGGGKDGGQGKDKDATQGKGARPGGGGFGKGGTPPDSVYQWRILCLDRNSGKILWNELLAKANRSSARINQTRLP